MRAFTSRRGGALGKLIVLLVVVGATGTLAWMLLLPSGVQKVLEKQACYWVFLD